MLCDDASPLRSRSEGRPAARAGFVAPPPALGDRRPANAAAGNAGPPAPARPDDFGLAQGPGDATGAGTTDATTAASSSARGTT
ncbi:MAG: hypothetical protein MUF34_07305 [Polyangiaceae bacterium]|nr:hypothetical protein [Polyangiaceae bacterium]